ncbi:MAG: hypothetical protein ACMUIP_02965 [bacterium]
MSVIKYKNPEDATRALWCFTPDAEYYRRVRELWRTANRLCPPRFPQGIFKYKTFEDAAKQKLAWLIENANI